MSRENRIARRLLEGHPIFWPPISGPEGHLYVTSGKGPGHSNLHAFDGDGELLWKTPPQQSTLMDPAILGFMFDLIQGWEMEVANTPALHPQTGRIYITAAGAEANSGVLYGIDVFNDRLEIAFQAPMGGGSGSSPAVSHDGRQVYALDEDGHMVAIDAGSGERLWQTPEGGGGSASPLDGFAWAVAGMGRKWQIGCLDLIR
jgi:outer membrane protein assembly factor BamB